MKDLYDIIIIGAGPAGLSAVYKIQNIDRSLSVLLIEKKVGEEKRISCAEGLGRRGFVEIMPMRPEWVRTEVDRAVFHSPDNTVVNFIAGQTTGYIINRAKMQQDLINDAVNNGAEGIFGHSVNSISVPDSNSKREVMLDDGRVFKACVVLDCSGPISRFGESEEIDSKAQDPEAAYFALVKNVKTDMDTVHVFADNEIAPGGYAWAFPHDTTHVNAGIVMSTEHRGSKNIKTLLSKFIEKQYPEGEVVSFSAGTIPCYKKPGIFAISGLIKAGDAANTVNPISRAGIAEAMKSGTMAASYAVEMVKLLDKPKNEKYINKLCKKYQKEWYKKLGKTHHRLAKVKKLLLKISNEAYDKGAHSLAILPQEKITMARIFKTCLGNFPSLVWELRHLM